VLEVAERGVRAAVADDPALRLGLCTARGHVTNPAVAQALGREVVDPLTALA